MATPLKGLTGLYGDPQDTLDVMDEGALEARANELAAEHGDYGSQHYGYSGQAPDASPFTGFTIYDGGTTGEDYSGVHYDEPGHVLDDTPDIHQAPYPRGIIQPSWGDPDAYARAGDQQLELHQPDLGGPDFFSAHDPTGRLEETHYTTDNYVAPNENILAKMPDQVRGSSSQSFTSSGGGSNADPDQGFGVVNTLPEFNAGHSIRRVQHDSMHFDYTNTHGEQDAPFMGRHPVQQMPLDGPDSPYYEMGDIDGANLPWEGRISDPSPYQAPVEPTIGPVITGNAADDVWAWS